MTFGDLFSGIGGFRLGLERSGHVCKWACEIDPFCRNVYKKHWPETDPFYKDIHDVRNPPYVDMLCGGFPCQPVSLAGRRKGTSDPRWLWPEFARLIAQVRPQIAFVENVPGLLSRGGADVLADLAEIGYDAEWESIPAAAVGAPHRRDRVWIVAYSKGARREARAVDTMGDRQSWPLHASRSGDVADERHANSGNDSKKPRVSEESANASRICADVADAPRSKRQGVGTITGGQQGRPANGGENVADTANIRCFPSWRHQKEIDKWKADDLGVFRGKRPETSENWATEPDVRVLADGVSKGLDGGVNGNTINVNEASSAITGVILQVLRGGKGTTSTSCGWRPDKQLACELADALCAVSYPLALEQRERTLAATFGYVSCLRQTCKEVGALRNTSIPLSEAWASLSPEEEVWVIVAVSHGLWWSEWPDVARVTGKVSARVDRLKSLGNAVVPAVVQWIGERIAEWENQYINKEE